MPSLSSVPSFDDAHSDVLALYLHRSNGLYVSLPLSHLHVLNLRPFVFRRVGAIRTMEEKIGTII
jgi:hypothetical protein